MGRAGGTGGEAVSRREVYEAMVARAGVAPARPPAPAKARTATTRPAEPGDPPGSQRRVYEDWSEGTRVEGVPVVTPASAEEVVDLCNWAVANGWKVRALGHAHNWSPLVVPAGTAASEKVVLVDTSGLKGTPVVEQAGDIARVRFGTGTTLDEASAFLATLDNGGRSPAPGYGFLNMPTIGELTLGGILAVGGHGTSVPATRPPLPEPPLMGCMSNLITSFEAVVTDPGGSGPPTYRLRRFDRAHEDAPALLVHLGRALVTEVTLAAVPNHYLQLTQVFAPVGEVMAPPSRTPGPASLASLLDAHGRVEVIWFPYQPTAWVQCARRQPGRIEPQVRGPYNYPWMNIIPRWLSDAVKRTYQDLPASVPDGLATELRIARSFVEGRVLNGTARDLQLYLTSNTLRMGAFGYVAQLLRGKVQAAVSAFFGRVQQLLARYGDRYPVNGAVEIRCTTVDDPSGLGIPGARPPALSAAHAVHPDVDTVLWVDVLTFPGTPGSNELLCELEQWVLHEWLGDGSPLVRPEWSKGWAYTPEGPWTNGDVVRRSIPAAYDAAGDGLTFSWARERLAAYDRGGLFTNGFLSTLFA